MSIEETWTRLARYAFMAEWLPGRKVIEIGCGDGLGAALLADHAERVVSVDPSPDVVARARLRTTRTNLEFEHRDPLSSSGLDFPDRAFDLVCLPALDAWLEQPRLLLEIRRLLAPGGLAYVAASSADLPGATSGLGYQDFADALGRAFPSVRLIAQSPGIHFTLTEFALEGEIDPSLDGSLLDDSDPCTHYAALCGDGDLPRPGYSVVSVPHLALAEDRSAAGAADLVRLQARVAEAEARADLLDTELREERARARREAPGVASAPAPSAELEETRASLRAAQERVAELEAGAAASAADRDRVAELEETRASLRAAQERVAELEALRQADAWRAEEDGGPVRDEQALAALRDGAQLHEQEALRLQSELADLRAFSQELEGERDEAERQKTQHAEHIERLTTHCDELEREVGRRGMRIAELEGRIKGLSLRGETETA